MVIYIICLVLVSIGFIAISSKRYGYDNFDIGIIILTAVGVSFAITAFTLAGLRTVYEPTIESVFPEEYAIYAANEDKLFDYEQLNEKGMLSEAGKDKVMALTELNADLNTKLEDKLTKSETAIKYKEKEPSLITIGFTSVFIVNLIIVVIYSENQLMGAKKYELAEILIG